MGNSHLIWLNWQWVSVKAGKISSSIKEAFNTRSNPQIVVFILQRTLLISLRSITSKPQMTLQDAVPVTSQNLLQFMSPSEWLDWWKSNKETKPHRSITEAYTHIVHPAMFSEQDLCPPEKITEWKSIDAVSVQMYTYIVILTFQNGLISMFGLHHS